ncbi:hotdog family protein, partial [Francisella tularensis]|uniref:3-hydroxyacyl-[acyl-carrier-protein] dehydratase FabZ n=1 Tax=Francisella tularensis TaxID=263 RepID=UPI0016805516
SCNIVDISSVAQKNITRNKDLLKVHIPDFQFMTGLQIVEAMAQATGILGELMVETLSAPVVEKAEVGRRTIMLAGIYNVRGNRPFIPGDVIVLKARLVIKKTNICITVLVAKVDVQIDCSTELMSS